MVVQQVALQALFVPIIEKWEEEFIDKSVIESSTIAFVKNDNLRRSILSALSLLDGETFFESLNKILKG